jgi:uncharacterized membrane protein
MVWLALMVRGGEMRSKFAIQGHPLHPLLVTVPIGLLVWTLAADFIFLATDELIWFEIARWTGVAAIVSALLAALPGFGDYLTMGFAGKARQVATAHMLLNLTVVGAYIAAALFMFSTAVGIEGDELSATFVYTATGLHAFGVALLLVSGWLGGEMVYRYRLGVMTEATTGADGLSGRRPRPVREAQRVEQERAAE